MIFIKSRSIIGGVKKLIKFIFESIYWVFSFLHLQFALFVALVGLIMYICGLFTLHPEAKLWFLVALFASILLGFFLMAKKLFNSKEKKDGKRKVKKDKNQDEEQVDGQEESQVEDYKSPQVEKPKYYNVNGHPNFIMAEYSDRVELFKKTENGLVKVRVDYKRDVR